MNPFRGVEGSGGIVGVWSARDGIIIDKGVLECYILIVCFDILFDTIEKLLRCLGLVCFVVFNPRQQS